MGSTDWIPAEVDTDRPSAARLYDYYLGGGHHFAADRELAQRIYQVVPETPYMARMNRAFLRRATEFCARQGIRQFLDLGCGLPTTGAVHEIAQAIDPAARVMYVDDEPVAVAHSELILEHHDNTAVLHADLRNPDHVLNHPRTRRLLDLSQPIALLTVAVLHFVSDADDPAGIIRRYREAMAPGSYFVLSHGTGDTLFAEGQSVVELYRDSQNPGYLRTKAEVAALLDGFDLVEPGLVFVPRWRPASPEDAEDAERSSFYGAVGLRR